MSNESSNTTGKAGMEVGLSTAKFFQHLFERDGSSSLEGAFDRDDNPSSKSNESPRLSKGQRMLRSLPKHVQKEISKIVEAPKETPEKSEKVSLRSPSSFHFRKGFAIGVKMSKSTDIELSDLSQVFEEIRNAQPNNEYLQGLYKGALHGERTEELNRLANRLTKEKGRGR